MRCLRIAILLAASVSLGGCAGLQFNSRPEPDALTYNEPVPYMLVTTTKDCVTTATVVSIPGRQRSVAFRSGYGSADLAVNLDHGIITSVNQKTDTKIPETITAVSGLATALGKSVAAVNATKKEVICKPTAKLHAIKDGLISQSSIDFPVTVQTVDTGG